MRAAAKDGQKLIPANSFGMQTGAQIGSPKERLLKDST